MQPRNLLVTTWNGNMYVAVPSVHFYHTFGQNMLYLRLFVCLYLYASACVVVD